MSNVSKFVVMTEEQFSIMREMAERGVEDLDYRFHDELGDDEGNDAKRRATLDAYNGIGTLEPIEMAVIWDLSDEGMDLESSLGMDDEQAKSLVEQGLIAHTGTNLIHYYEKLPDADENDVLEALDF